MRLLGMFSKTIFKLAAGKSLQKIRTNSIETVLKKSVRIIDPQTLTEMRKFVISHQTSEGGFADKAGNCDLYYTLFGCFIAEALEVHEVIPRLKEYIKNVMVTKTLKGVYLQCAVILYVKLFGSDALPSVFQNMVSTDLRKHENQKGLYSDFINLLAWYYLEDYSILYKVNRKLKTNVIQAELPCSVTAAHLILRECFGKPVKESKDRLYAFYGKNGSFSAVNRAPVGDLLSTGVALYALRFINTDIRIIKPECLTFVDSLYSEGGFCATSLDTDPDVEYTFYGLLALGALAD
jgi:hypothetical protein